MTRLKRIAETSPPPVSSIRKDLPPGLSSLVDRMLARDRNRRPGSASEVAKLLEPWAAPAQSNRLKWVTGIAAVASFGILGAVLFHDGPRPILTEQQSIDLALDPATTPQLHSREWDVEQIIDAGRGQRGARFTIDGSIISVAFRDAANPQATRWRLADGNFVAEPIKELPFRGGSWRAYVAPDSGHILTTDPNHPEFCRLTRYTPELREMKPLVYSDRRFSSLESLAFVRPGAVPKLNKEGLLQEGDILVADSGRGKFIGRGSLWKCRLDNDEPLQLLAEDSILTAPVDVTISRNGIFIFNRNAGYGAAGTVIEADTRQRVIRWDGAKFFGCTVSEPIRDPSGMVADPLSDALFATEGSSISGGVPGQRLLKLTPTGKPDDFRVEVIADRFGQFASGSVAISEDGKRIILADNALSRIFILRRN